jgi:hypothetical protein
MRRTQRNTARVVLVILVGFAMTLVASSASAKKTDVVILLNGDRITGEIKTLERGRLKLNTDPADNIYIHWTDVQQLTSDSLFEIEARTGQRYYGRLSPVEGQRLLYVIGLLDSLALAFDDVVSILPIKQTFWARIDGSIDVGLSYTQANALLQWSFDSEVKYRAPNFSSSLEVSSTISDQTDVKRTSRQDLAARNTRFFKRLYMSNLTWSMMHNDELGVDLRLTLSGSGGAYWLKTNTVQWGAFVGLSVTSERSTSGTGFSKQLEAPLNMEFETFTYSTPKRDVTVSFSVIPRLKVHERVRTELNAKVKWEIVKDFYVSMSALNSTDNKPPEGAQANTDLTLTTALGYSF